MDFIKDWGMIAGLAGIALGVFVILFREVISKNIFSVLTKKQSYTIIIVFMILVWALAIFCIIEYYQGKSEEPAQVTVLVHGERGKDDLVLPNRGQVKLIYGDANVIEIINSKGEATFKQIPEKFFSPKAKVEILFSDPNREPYGVVKPDSLYQLTKGQYISLEVKLYGLGILKGTVKDFETGALIQNARISILGIETFSNQYGEYTLSIPPKLQQKFQTVRCLKDQYEPYEYKDVPVQTENEFPILMKRKHNGK
jgi:hypothetical protein